jgi:hypothetical protein
LVTYRIKSRRLSCKPSYDIFPISFQYHSIIRVRNIHSPSLLSRIISHLRTPRPRRINPNLRTPISRFRELNAIFVRARSARQRLSIHHCVVILVQKECCLSPILRYRIAKMTVEEVRWLRSRDGVQKSPKNKSRGDVTPWIVSRILPSCHRSSSHSRLLGRLERVSQKPSFVMSPCRYVPFSRSLFLLSPQRSLLEKRVGWMGICRQILPQVSCD